MTNHTNPSKTAECCGGACETTPAKAAFRPAIDVIETESEFLVKLDVAGATKDDIEVSLDEGVLTVQASVQPRAPQNARLVAAEYGVGDFRRSFRLGDGVDAENVTADQKDGVLTLRLPKTAAGKPRKIAVTSG